MVLRDVQNGSSEMWHESVELERVWRCVFVADFDAQNGVVETGNDRLFPCGRVDPKAKNDGRQERPNARESFAHDGDGTGLDGDKRVDERRHRTRAFHSL